MDRKRLKNASDAELVDLAHEGSAAYAELVRRHYQRCARRAYSILKEPADAEDAVQDSLLRALLKLDQLEDPERFAAWLDRIVVSCCLSRLRRKRPEPLGTEADERGEGQAESDVENPEAALITREREEAVRDAINALPERYRDPLRLFHYGGHSYKNIAQVLDLPLGTVQSLISRAREQLEELLKPYERTALCTA